MPQRCPQTNDSGEGGGRKGYLRGPSTVIFFFLLCPPLLVLNDEKKKIHSTKKKRTGHRFSVFRGACTLLRQRKRCRRPDHPLQRIASRSRIFPMGGWPLPTMTTTTTTTMEIQFDAKKNRRLHVRRGSGQGKRRTSKGRRTLHPRGTTYVLLRTTTTTTTTTRHKKHPQPCVTLWNAPKIPSLRLFSLPNGFRCVLLLRGMSWQTKRYNSPKRHTRTSPTTNLPPSHMESPLPPQRRRKEKRKRPKTKERH